MHTVCRKLAAHRVGLAQAVEPGRRRVRQADGAQAGIIAGAMLVLIPVVGEFVIPEMLGGADTLMIGRVLWQEFFNNRDWPVASAVAIVMLVLLIVPITIFHRYQSKEMESKLT